MNAENKVKTLSMNFSSFILFLFRLFLYLSVIILIFIHPGISVSFDRIGIMQWFVIIPVMAIIAFLNVSGENLLKKYLCALAALIILSFIACGLNPDFFILFTAGLISFFFSMMLFHKKELPFHSSWVKITALEPFFLAWITLRLLALSRSGEEIAGESVILTQFILIWTIAVFLLHSAVIYLCLYPNSRAKAWQEAAVFSGVSIVFLTLVLAVLPADFVRNMVNENLVTERVPQRIQSSDAERGIPQRGNGRRTLPLEEGGQGELRGVSEHEWPGSGNGDGSEESRQYLVKIVVSEREPVYMGDSFRGQLDPVEGFLISPQETVNQITGQRNFVTWFYADREYNLNRRRYEIYSLSTLRQKYFPWRPYSADPVILNENAGPLRYIHQVVSDIHNNDPLMLVNNPTRYFTEQEKSNLAGYLDVPLSHEDKKVFEDYLNYALDLWKKNREEIISSDRYLSHVFSGLYGRAGNEYLETIIALLTSFFEYQYNLAYDDNYSIAALKDFLLFTKDGDCVEFSNTLALLGRLAGIPSRVVTGYLAAESLQTPAHLDGLSVLRSRIPFLQQFPFDNLFMVTNAHSHSWTQFYIPSYGWLDFEATSFAIPPVGMGDLNNWDVVIPILDENRTFSSLRKFPWQAVGRTALTLLIAAVILAYVLRYGREFILYLGAQKGNYRRRARCLYLHLLARLAADSHPIKPASKTAHEYAELFTGKNELFKPFADIYSELRWREFNNNDEINERILLLKQEYQTIINSTRKRGLLHAVKRIFNLRGLAYL